MYGRHDAYQTKPLRLDVKGQQKVFPMSEEMGLALVAMIKALDGFKSWAEAAAPEFPVLGEGWDIATDISGDVDSMKAFAAKVVGDMLRSWTAKLQDSASKIEDLCIPQALLQSSRMMTEKASQQALASSAKRLHDSNLLQIAREQLAVVKAFESEVEALAQLNGKSSLMRWRRLGRVAIATQWAIEEVLTFKPESPADLVSQAGKIESKLKQKGFMPSAGPHGEIPSYLWKCLERMRAEGAKFVAAAEAAG